MTMKKSVALVYKDGSRVTYSIEIDLVAVAQQLGSLKARVNKSKKSTALQGAVVVTVEAEN